MAIYNKTNRLYLIINLILFSLILAIFDGATHTAMASVTGDSIPIRPQSAPAGPPNPISIKIDIGNRTLTVFSGDQSWRSYPVCVGSPKTPSPVGEWKINHLDRDWGNGFGPRFIGLSIPWGKYGIHGTNKPWSIGNGDSHGCIRMNNENVIELYHWVKMGTLVKIEGSAHWTTGWLPNPISRESSPSPHLVFVQQSLKNLGYYPYYCDAFYGALTELALRQFQVNTGLPDTGKVDEQTYKLLQEMGGVSVAPEPATL